MASKKKAPELTFQKHIADYHLVREHKYGVLEQSDITDTEHFIAEDQLWAFLAATQADTLKKLAGDYGTDAREEVFKALRRALEHSPLWMLFREGLKVRGLEHRRGRHRQKVSGGPLRRQRQDIVDQLAGRSLAQPFQTRHEREAGGHHLHPHGPQIARY